jgi:hypothetical protein
MLLLFNLLEEFNVLLSDEVDTTRLAVSLNEDLQLLEDIVPKAR